MGVGFVTGTRAFFRRLLSLKVPELSSGFGHALGCGIAGLRMVEFADESI
jgi:hypothetical protein